MTDPHHPAPDTVEAIAERLMTEVMAEFNSARGRPLHLILLDKGTSIVRAERATAASLVEEARAEERERPAPPAEPTNSPTATERPHPMRHGRPDHEWAGNPARQKAIADSIMRKFGDSHPIDLVGALETIMANMICDVALTQEAALEGLKEVAGDMEATIRERFKKQSA